MAFGGWGTFLAGVAGPVAKRVLSALGFGVVATLGVQAAITTALNSVKAAVGGMSGVVADLVAMTGFFSALSIIAGGLVASGSLMALKKLSII